MPEFLTELPFYKWLIKVTTIAGRGFRTAFGTKPLKLPFASGKTLKYFLLPGVCRRGSCGEHPVISQNIHCGPSYQLPLFSFKFASGLHTNSRTLVTRPQRKGQLPGLKASWMSHCEMTQTGVIQENCTSQGLKFIAS